MSVPLTLSEQKRKNWFRPAKKYGLYIGISKYQDLGLIDFPDRPQVEANVVNFSKCMEKY